jgi:hypothetical protein
VTLTKKPENSKDAPMFRKLCLGVLLLNSAVLLNPARAGVMLSFGGYTWDQDNVPNMGFQLGVNDSTTRSGASFGPANDTNLTRTGNITGFIESQAGANTAVGYLSRITQRKTSEAPAKLETAGTRAVNIPTAADVGTAIVRRGIQVGWTAGTSGFATPVMVNGTGTDIVVWESGNANQPDAIMARARNAVTQQFTDWYFFTAASSPTVTGGTVLFAYAYDLSNFGLLNGAQVDLIEMANMVSTDRIDAPGTNTANGWVAQGRVRPEAGGAFSATNPGPDPGNISPPYGVPFGGGTYDPDPLYVSVLSGLQNLTVAPVPELASALVWSLIISAGVLAGVRHGRSNPR